MRIDSSICVKNSADAIKLYLEAFGLELGYHVQNPDGSFFHSELNKDGVGMLCVVESTYESCADHNTVMLGITFDSEEEVHRAFK